MKITKREFKNLVRQVIKEQHQTSPARFTTKPFKTLKPDSMSNKIWAAIDNGTVTKFPAYKVLETLEAMDVPKSLLNGKTVDEWLDDNDILYTGGDLEESMEKMGLKFTKSDIMKIYSNTPNKSELIGNILYNILPIL